ncbi:MAG: hypothetical protein DRQ78_05950 [Epsilonproteobacteria bacterium]|nr:MAG: hypothetical protein DRQ78_05950 [Campylobacterota bacterium]
MQNKSLDTALKEIVQEMIQQHTLDRDKQSVKEIVNELLPAIDDIITSKLEEFPKLIDKKISEQVKEHLVAIATYVIERFKD